MDPELLEAFALADDRAEVLGRLVPGTEEHYFLRCLHAQHTGALDEVGALVSAWIDHHGQTSRVHEVLDRQAVLLLGTDAPSAGEALKRLRQRLGPNLAHRPEVEGQEERLPTRLDANLLTRSSFVQRWLRGRRLDAFTDAALPWLLEEELDPEQRRELLGRLRRPDHPTTVRHVLADLEHRHSGGFGSLPIHRRLLAEQLDALAFQRPKLKNDPAWVDARLVRLQPGPDERLDEDPAARERHLERLWAFVQPLAPAFNGLKALVLYHRLDHDRRQGVYDRERFLAYLALPVRGGLRSSEYLERPAHRAHVTDLGAEQRSTLLEPVYDDTTLVQELLLHHLRGAADTRPYEVYLREDVCNASLAEANLLAGHGEPERWYALLGSPQRVRDLRERIDLDLAPENPEVVGADEVVRLTVDVKNVRDLVVKVFEVDAFNVLSATGKEVDAAIDLDGLVPGHEHVLRYEEPPLRRVRRVFELSALTEPGTYVVELVGNGKSSRAVVRKGALRALERIGAAGHVFRILDEAGRPAPDATLWLDGREQRPDAEGEVCVPFSTRGGGRRTAILRRGTVASAWPFQHLAEEYRFQAAVHAERESLVAGREATVLVRPSLTVHGRPVDLGLIEEPHLVVTCTDREGVESAREVPDVALSPEREATYTFRVPDEVVRVEVELRGRVRRLSGGEPLELSDGRAWDLNGIDGSEFTAGLHLARSEAGYVLHLLGRTGEPLPDVAVRVWLMHRDLNRELDASLQTDAQGRVELGTLDGVRALRAEAAGTAEQRWDLQRTGRAYPSVVHAAQGEAIRVPLSGTTGLSEGASGEALRRWVGLWELRSELPAQDRLGSCRVVDGALELEGLPAGELELVLEGPDARIQLRVVPGQRAAGWLVGQQRLLEASSPRVLRIARAQRRADGALEVQLAGAGPRARLHAFATRFVPAHVAHAELSVAPARTPRVELLEAPRCDYLSNRALGDEVRYVLERRYARAHPGNMLDRPGLLLNPWALRSTSTSRDTVSEGDDYRAKERAKKRSGAQPPRSQAMLGGAGGSLANLDFLERGAGVVANLAPDANGRVVVPAAALEGATLVTLVAAEGVETATQEVVLPEVPVARQDLRFRLNLDPEGHFLERRAVAVLDPEQGAQAAGTPTKELVIEDLATSTLEVLDTLGRAHRLLSALTGDDTLDTFAFVTRWPQLSPSEQRARYSEHACHELNLFLARRDPEFFEAVVRPYLANKLHKTFMDRYLLDQDLSAYLEPWAYGRLNAAERALLAGRVDGEGQATGRSMDDELALRPHDPVGDELRFRAALRSSALEDEALEGLGAARDQAMQAMEEMAASRAPMKKAKAMAPPRTRGAGAPPRRLPPACPCRPRPCE